MSNQPVFKVSSLNEYIKVLLEGNSVLQRLQVEGEISGFKKYPSSGHCYFTLKDDKSVISCVMFRGQAANLNFAPQNGQAVLMRCRVSAYPPRGNYQLIVDRMMPLGEGNLQLQYEALKAKLSEEGVFKTEVNRRPLPSFPKKIGIVTSPMGAVIRDMYRVISRRWPLADILLVPAVVQGSDGAASIISGLKQLYERDDIDVIITGRGGGSLEDLWNFNEESVVRMIAASPVPIISAVGHETDVTLADFAADLRAGTPSIAGEMVVMDQIQLRNRIREMEERATKQMRYLLEQKQKQLNGYLSVGYLQDASNLLAGYYMKLDQKTDELEHRIQTAIAVKNSQFVEKTAALEALNPLRVMSRGFSYCENETGVVSSVAQLAVSDELQLHLSDGVVTVTVTAIEENED